MKDSLDKFGEFVIENLFDQGIRKFQKLSNGEIKAPSLKILQEELKSFNERELETIQKLIIEVMTSSSHDLLFAIQECSDLEDGIQVKVDNKNVVELSDELHGEIFTENGWIKKYSAYKDLYKEE